MARIKVERIKALRGEKSGRLIAGLAGIAQPYFSQIERGERNPTLDVLSKLAGALNTSVAYLTGETDDPSPVGLLSPPDGMDRENIQANLRPSKEANMIRVRVISKHFAVCCGTGIDWGADDGVDYEKSIWIDNSQLAMKYTNDELISVHADGDSMEPYISDNDLVIFSPNEQEITSPGILMVVNYNGKMIVRGLIVNGQKQVIMKPHNKRYDDITVTDNDIFRICGRVVEIHATKKPTPVL